MKFETGCSNQQGFQMKFETGCSNQQGLQMKFETGCSNQQGLQLTTRSANYTSHKNNCHAKMKSRLVMIKYAGYVLGQLFQRLYIWRFKCVMCIHYTV